jgi:hypothetical protein
MVKLVGLIPVLTAVQGLPETIGSSVARSVRAARWVNTGPRGPGGADMTDWDAANLLLGITCSDQAKDAGFAVPRYRDLFGRVIGPMTTSERREPDPDKPGWGRIIPPESLCPEPLRWLTDTARGLTLGQALDRLIGMAREGTLQTLFRELAGKRYPEPNIDKAIGRGEVYLRLEFQRPRPGAIVTFGEHGAGSGPYLATEFGYQSARETIEELDRLQTGDRTETVTVSHRTIFALGEAQRQ